MGEAKRRRDAVASGGPVEYTSLDGSRKIGRAAPSVREFAETWHAAGERIEATVPCNGCTACCHHDVIDFELAGERPEDLAHLAYDEIPDQPGMAKLVKRADGGCIHLGPEGCTVHPHRPKVCRVYDCRAYLIAGISQEFGPARHTPPFWVAADHTLEDRVWSAALRWSAMLFMQQHPDGQWYADEAVQAAWMRLPDLLPAVQRLAAEMQRLGPEGRRALLADIGRNKSYAELIRGAFPGVKVE